MNAASQAAHSSRLSVFPWASRTTTPRASMCVCVAASPPSRAGCSSSAFGNAGRAIPPAKCQRPACGSGVSHGQSSGSVATTSLTLECALPACLFALERSTRCLFVCSSLSGPASPGQTAPRARGAPARPMRKTRPQDLTLAGRSDTAPTQPLFAMFRLMPEVADVCSANVFL